MKHTPGPWSAEHALKEGIILGSDMIAVVNGDGVAITHRSEEENRANAAIISAAPELLEACKDALLIIKEDIKEIGPCDHSANICVCGLISAAELLKRSISKAEGSVK